MRRFNLLVVLVSVFVGSLVGCGREGAAPSVVLDDSDVLLRGKGLTHEVTIVQPVRAGYVSKEVVDETPAFLVVAGCAYIIPEFYREKLAGVKEGTPLTVPSTTYKQWMRVVSVHGPEIEKEIVEKFSPTLEPGEAAANGPTYQSRVPANSRLIPKGDSRLVGWDGKRCQIFQIKSVNGDMNPPSPTAVKPASVAGK